MTTGESFGGQDDHLFAYGETDSPTGLENGVSANGRQGVWWIGEPGRGPLERTGSTYTQGVQGERGLHPRTPLPLWHGKAQCPEYTGWIGAKNHRTKDSWLMPAGCGQWHCLVCGTAKTLSWKSRSRKSWNRYFESDRSALVTLKMPWKPAWMSMERFLEERPRWEFAEETTGAQINAVAKELEPIGTKWGSRAAASLYVQLGPQHSQRLWTTWLSNLRARYYKRFGESMEYLAVPEWTKQGAMHLHMVIPERFTKQGRGEWMVRTWRQIVPGSHEAADGDDGVRGGYRKPRKDLSPLAGVGYLSKYLMKAAKVDWRSRGYQRIRRFRRTKGFKFPIRAWTDSFQTRDGRPIDRHYERSLRGRFYYWMKKNDIHLGQLKGETREKLRQVYQLLRSRKAVFQLEGRGLDVFREMRIWWTAYGNVRMTEAGYMSERLIGGTENYVGRGFEYALQWPEGQLEREVRAR